MSLPSLNVCKRARSQIGPWLKNKKAQQLVFQFPKQLLDNKYQILICFACSDCLGSDFRLVVIGFSIHLKLVAIVYDCVCVKYGWEIYICNFVKMLILKWTNLKVNVSWKFRWLRKCFFRYYGYVKLFFFNLFCCKYKEIFD